MQKNIYTKIYFIPQLLSSLTCSSEFLIIVKKLCPKIIIMIKYKMAMNVEKKLHVCIIYACFT